MHYNAWLMYKRGKSWIEVDLYFHQKQNSMLTVCDRIFFSILERYPWHQYQAWHKCASPMAMITKYQACPWIHQKKKTQPTMKTTSTIIEEKERGQGQTVFHDRKMTFYKWNEETWTFHIITLILCNGTASVNYVNWPTQHRVYLKLYSNPQGYFLNGQGWRWGY